MVSKQTSGAIHSSFSKLASVMLALKGPDLPRYPEHRLSLTWAADWRADKHIFWAAAILLRRRTRWERWQVTRWQQRVAGDLYCTGADHNILPNSSDGENNSDSTYTSKLGWTRWAAVKVSVLNVSSFSWITKGIRSYLHWLECLMTILQLLTRLWLSLNV